VLYIGRTADVKKYPQTLGAIFLYWCCHIKGKPVLSAIFPLVIIKYSPCIPDISINIHFKKKKLVLYGNNFYKCF
jgi:hypothetical protein